MIRLTSKDRHIRFIGFKQRNAGEQKIADIYDKLGQLEDLMEKYEINSIEALEETLKENKKLKSNLARWLALLETDGIDSKNMVATDIQCLLKQLNNDTIKQSEGGKQ